MDLAASWTRAAPGRRVLRLYISDRSIHSHRAVANLRLIVAACRAEEVSAEIVHMDDDPLRAYANGVKATPTLIQLSPGPERRVIGDLSDLERVFAALGIDPRKEDST